MAIKRRGILADDFSESKSRDNLALSFLDVLSCGLGGAVCLFLIFSVMPHFGQAGGLASSTGSFTGNESGRPIGAKFIDWKDQVANSVFSLSFKLHGNLETNAVEFRNLPAHCIFGERGTNSTIEFFAFNDQGVRPPSRKSEIWIKPGSFRSPRTRCEISVMVGGYAQQTNIVVTNAPTAAGAQPIKVISINLLSTNSWFE